MRNLKRTRKQTQAHPAEPAPRADHRLPTAEEVTVESVRALQRAVCQGGLIVDLHWADAKADDGEPVSEYNSPELGYSRAAAPACLHLERLGLVVRTPMGNHAVFEVTPLGLRVLRQVGAAIGAPTRALLRSLELLAGGRLVVEDMSPVETAAVIQDRVIAAAAGYLLPPLRPN